MTETTTLGPYLRRERERRGLALRTISENTKVSLALLEGLETDDISRWPGGIFRRAFVRSYASCVGLDTDDVIRRFEAQFPPDELHPADVAEAASIARHASVVRPFPPRPGAGESRPQMLPARARAIGTAADLGVAVIFAFGCAAAGAGLVWPVLMIAAYYAGGVLVTGTSPMVALLSDGLGRARAARAKEDPVAQPAAAPPIAAEPEPALRTAVRHEVDRAVPRAARRSGDRPVRQRRGMQAPV